MTPLCPHCDEPLEAIEGHPDWAPWVCRGCHHGYWNAELTDEARAMYRPEYRDWGLHPAAWKLREAVKVEREGQA